MIRAQHLRRVVSPSPCDLCVLSVSALHCSFSIALSNFQLSTSDFQPSPSCNSFPAISFADPHPLTLLESYRFENVTGRGRLQPSDTKPLLSRHRFASISHLDATLTDLPASVANKRLTVLLSPLDATLTKNTGVGSRLSTFRPSTFRRLDVATIPYPPKSLPLNLFADPHPLNLYATILYKNSGGPRSGCAGILPILACPEQRRRVHPERLVRREPFIAPSLFTDRGSRITVQFPATC